MAINNETINALTREEVNRQNNTLNLIASENYPSKNVCEALGSVFTAKYAEGYPGERYYGGCEVVDKLEAYARDLAMVLFEAEHVNVQPHSGAQANMAVYQALLEPGDTVLSLNLKDGGHLTHGSPANASGKLYNFVHYSPATATGLDYDRIAILADNHKPKLIVAGGSSTIAEINWAELAYIAEAYGAYLMADIAHTAGFIAAKILPSPASYADVVTMTTQKTLRGPRGGIILCKSEHKDKIDRAVFPGTQGGPHMNVIAAKAVALDEAGKMQFRDYMTTVASITEEFTRITREIIRPTCVYYNKRAMPHMVMIDTYNMYGLTGWEAQRKLGEYDFIVNKQVLPDDLFPPSAGSGIRLGFAALTTRIMDHSRNDHGTLIDVIAHSIDLILSRREGEYLDRYYPYVQNFLKCTPVY